MIDELIKAKEDIKTAIVNKGCVIEGGMVTYADAIRSINAEKLPIDWSLLGYSEEEISIVREAMQKRIDQEISFEKQAYTDIQESISTGSIDNTYQPFHDKYKSVMFPVLYDTSQYTEWKDYDLIGGGFFGNCGYMACMPLYDTSNITDMSMAFEYCSAIAVMPKLDLSKCKNINMGFYACSSLLRLPEFDFSNVTNVEGMLYGCTALVDIGGFKNLGKAEKCSGTSYMYINVCKDLTKESLLNVLNGLYDRASAGYSVLTIKLHANHHALLTDEELAIATNKGWIVM